MNEPPDNHEPPDHAVEETYVVESLETADKNEASSAHRVAIGSEADSVTEAVVSAVAVYSNTNPAEQTPIANVVDSDALNRIFQSCGPDLHVTFSYCDYEVTVHGTHEITLTPSDN